MGSDWGVALRLALPGQLVLVVLGAMLTMLMLLAQAVSSAAMDVDVPALLISPLQPVLAWAGGGIGGGDEFGFDLGAGTTLATAIVYTLLAFRLAGKLQAATLGPRAQSLAGDRPRLLAAAVKTGAVNAAALFSIALILNLFATDVLRRSFAFGLGGRASLLALVVQSTLVGGLAGLVTLSTFTRTPLRSLSPAKWQPPAVLTPASIGLKRTLLIAVPAVLAVFLIGSLAAFTDMVEIFSRDGVAFLMFMTGGIVVGWLDMALMLIVGASQFLYDGGMLWAFGDLEWWMWLGPLVLAVSYALGGLEAAKAAAPTSKAAAAWPALLIGPLVGLAAVIPAIGLRPRGGTIALITISLLLPSVWGLVSAGTAWLAAGQRGLPSGLQLAQYPGGDWQQHGQGQWPQQQGWEQQPGQGQWPQQQGWEPQPGQGQWPQQQGWEQQPQQQGWEQQGGWQQHPQQGQWPQQ